MKSINESRLRLKLRSQVAFRFLFLALFFGGKFRVATLKYRVTQSSPLLAYHYTIICSLCAHGRPRNPTYAC